MMLVFMRCCCPDVILLKALVLRSGMMKHAVKGLFVLSADTDVLLAVISRVVWLEVKADMAL